MIPASWAAAPNCAMGLPSDDDGELPFAALLPSDDDGLVELPSGDCDDGGASSSQGIAKRRRRGPAQQRGRVDGDVSDLPEEAVNEESVATGDIDLPEEVANDELDDLFVDVTTASPKKEDRSLAKTHREKRNTLVCSRGPPLQISRPRWCRGVLLMWRLTWAAPLVAPYRTMSWRCSRPPGF